MLKRFFRSKVSPVKPSAVSGFTLIEILVSLVIASLIVATLLSVLVGVLQSNKREDAKTKSQEELQAAANYIANDLQQAVYIYPAEAFCTALPTVNPKCIGALIPQSTATFDRTPILAFWKRFALLDKERVKNASDPDTTTVVECIEGSSCLRRDTFVYSLVVYYLEKGGSGGNVSKSVTISRFEARDGIVAPQCQTNTGEPNCDITDLVKTTRYYSFPTTVEGSSTPDQVAGGNILSNFQPFSFRNGELTWTTTDDEPLKVKRGNDDKLLRSEGVLKLVDYLDDTPYDPVQDSGSGGFINVLRPDSVTSGNSTFDPDGAGPLPAVTLNDCEEPSKGGLGFVSTDDRATRIPADFSTLPAGLNVTSFYVCVRPKKATARIFIRGNALVRLGVKDRTPTETNFTFFPEVDVISSGRGIVVPQ